MGKIGRAYVKAIDRFRLDHDIPVVRFKKGDCKEEIARSYLQRAERERRFGVVLIGVAQEKTSAWRGWRDGGPDSHPHFEYRRQSIFPRVGFRALDNGFVLWDDPTALSEICGRLGAQDVHAFFERWQGRLPTMSVARMASNCSDGTALTCSTLIPSLTGSIHARAPGAPSTATMQFGHCPAQHSRPRRRWYLKLRENVR